MGAFIGALIFSLIDTFAATDHDRDRFNTLIGLVFLVILVASPDGVLGLAKRLAGWRRPCRPEASRATGARIVLPGTSARTCCR